MAHRRFFQDLGRPIEIPAAALPSRPELLTDGRGSIDHPPRRMAARARARDHGLRGILRLLALTAAS